MSVVYQKQPGYDYSYESKIQSIYKENDNVYLNVTINNQNVTSQGIIDETFNPATYDVTKTLPILDKSSDYYCSIIRFDIPLNVIPIFIMPIVPASAFINPQPNPNLTPLIIGITYLGVDYAVNLIYVPDNTILPPVQNMVGSQIITPYYFVFSYQNLINSLNTALATAVTNSGFPLGGAQTPWFYIDHNTQLTKLVVPTAFTVPGVGQPTIFGNSMLIGNYLSGFETNFLGLNQVAGKDIIFDLSNPTIDKGYVLFGTAPITPAYYIFSNEYSTLNNWTSLRKLLITTNSIPITNEFISLGNTNGVAASFPILTDFVPAFEFAGQSRSIAYYYPTSQYRLVDMINDTPLYKINLTIYWEDKEGNFYQLLISRGQQANIKIGFFRKSLYKPLNPLLYK